MTVIKDVPTKLVEWVVEEVDEIDGTYDYPAGDRDQLQPCVEAEVIRVIDGADPEDFGLRMEQREVRVFECALLLAVDPTPPRDASRKLYEFAETLSVSLRGDKTLDGRVFRVHRQFSFDFQPPDIKFADDTEARGALMRLQVAELVEV